MLCCSTGRKQLQMDEAQRKEAAEKVQLQIDEVPDRIDLTWKRLNSKSCSSRQLLRSLEGSTSSKAEDEMAQLQAELQSKAAAEKA